MLLDVGECLRQASGGGQSAGAVGEQNSPQPGPRVFRPGGTYFVTTDITPLGEQDGIEFCRGLPERCGVVAIPNAVFYDDVAAGRPLVRFTFCKRVDVLEEAVDRLTRLRPVDRTSRTS